MISRAVLITVVALLLVAFGMAFWLLHLKRQAEQQLANSPAETRPITAPIGGSAQSVEVLLADDDTGALRSRTLSVVLPSDPQQRAREVLRALIAECAKPGSPHRFAKDADVKDVYLLKDTAVVDVNTAFADGHPSGVVLEQLTISSLGATVAANAKEVKRIKLLVDGKERTTLAGHADLMALYDVESSTQKEVQ